jgi:DNA adenine methylase
MNGLPRDITKVIVPPIKCQGIKSKLVPFIAKNIHWDGAGRWIEPFMGSGVVAFNIMPKKALLADTNRHIIKFYQSVQANEVNTYTVAEYLSEMGNELKLKGADYYYEVRQRFNDTGNAFDFLFLNRACFNGLMRFNSKGGFNVPFGHKPQRFSKSYITKIKNQVERVGHIIRDNDWQFIVSDWSDTLALAAENDFVYLDPPYIGRHTDYYNVWNHKDAIALSNAANQLPCNYALSMWLENKYRKNDHIETYWSQGQLITTNHFYHVGSKESWRNSIIEALVLKNNRIAIAV